MTISQAGVDCLRLSKVKGFGLKTFRDLYAKLGSVDALANAKLDELIALGCKLDVAQRLGASNQVRTETAPDDVHQWLNGSKRRAVITLEDPLYPNLLKELYLLPPLLYLEGDFSLLKDEMLAVVGSRKPSLAAVSAAQALSHELAQAGWVVCSGLAMGIDAAAHKGALSAKGSTVAVVGTGIDRIYPKSNRALHADIVEHGLIISELPLGTPPSPQNFPRRNRLVSGLSRGVLVVEASLKSGSLITAGYAVEQNRDVFAVPGAMNNPSANGCNALIKQGAKLVDCADDILQEYGTCSPLTSMDERVADNEASEEPVGPLKSILEKMGGSVCSFDLLYESLDLSYELLTQSLFELEIDQRIATVAGGYQRMK